MACLQIYRELLSLATFLRVHSNSKEVSYLSWQNTYPNLKTTCHIKLKFFLWTKLLENLLHAKYLISVAAPLTGSNKFILNISEHISNGKNLKIKPIDSGLKNKRLACLQLPFRITSSSSYVNFETMNTIFSDIEINKVFTNNPSNLFYYCWNN